jgi:hypothetical protein
VVEERRRGGGRRDDKGRRRRRHRTGGGKRGLRLRRRPKAQQHGRRGSGASEQLSPGFLAVTGAALESLDGGKLH